MIHNTIVRWSVFAVAFILSIVPVSAAGKKEAPPAGPVTLLYWAPLNANVVSSIRDLNQNLVFQELEKRSGIKLQFRHPPVNQEQEQFNLVIASRDLPDLFEYDWTAYPGGPEKAISDGIIVKLNDLISKEAPNYKKYLDQTPTVAKQLMTDAGSLYVFAALSKSKYSVQGGLMLRKDWLDEAGLKVPETIDEWTTVLSTLKKAKSLTAPFSAEKNQIIKGNIFSGAWMVADGFYLNKGKVTYGPITDAYREYLAFMSGWYRDGLLDPDFVGGVARTVDANVTGSKTAALFGYAGGTMGKFLAAMKDKDPKFDLIGAQYPVLKKGDTPRFITRSWEYRKQGSLAITTTNKHAVASTRWADYLFSDDGNILKNFGVEGMTFKSDNGYPRYTDLIVKNPEGLSMAQAMGKYLRGSYPTPGFIDERYHEQFFQLPQQKAAVALWSKHDKDSLEVLLPPYSPTPAEAEELAAIVPSLESFKDEMFVKFVMGQEPLANFSSFVAQAKQMKVERALQLYQAAYDRYSKR